jgi:hypothetical protein
MAITVRCHLCVSIDENRGERGCFLFVRRHTTGESEMSFAATFFYIRLIPVLTLGSAYVLLLALWFRAMIGSCLGLAFGVGLLIGSSQISRL